MEMSMAKTTNEPQVIVVRTSEPRRRWKPWRPWWSYRPWYGPRYQSRYYGVWDRVVTVLFTFVGTIVVLVGLKVLLVE